MKKTLICLFAACAVVAACNREQSAEPVTGPAATVRLSISSALSKADFQTADEAEVQSIEAFIFNGNSLDAYASATAEEIAAGVMSVDCTQGTRDIWVVVNGTLGMNMITSRSALLSRVTSLLYENQSNRFVMVGKAEAQNVTATFSKTINVDRIASRVRLFQVKRKMSNSTLASLPASDFKIIRAYVTNVINESCVDIFTPTRPSSYSWYSAQWANSGEITTYESFIYNKLASPAALADNSVYGTAFVDESTVAPFTFYVYPNEFDSYSASPAHDQLKLVLECQIDGQFYTYPIPLGAVTYNKSYDVTLLTITRLGNNSDGDDNVDDGEDDVIQPATATFTINVNDWTQVLNFGGVSGGEITL